MEEIPNNNSCLTEEEQLCESHFISSYQVDAATQRYVVRLPFKVNAPVLGKSLRKATSCLQALERKFTWDHYLKEEYARFMTEYKELGHMEKIPDQILSQQCEHAYFPHHPVMKPTSTTTKLRVVFNGSSPTSNGVSLNQKLLVGPKTQRDLLPILLSFRSFRVAVVADVEKMYRQILLDMFVNYLVQQLHEKYFHAGITLLLNILRQHYWIISCRTVVKTCIRNCVTCTRHRANVSSQLMANLPKHRVSAFKPFENVGVDYAGPLQLLLRRGRGAKSTKGYLVIFVCFCTRAIHLELAGDLTADTFISCLKRFSSRRGLPSVIYTDNGTNFVGANRYLKEIDKFINSLYKEHLISNFLSSNSITWKFNPPSSPHFGGLWEAGVKVVKTSLKRVIGETKLTYEEMYTTLVQIEGLLNSRPLVPISDDPSNLDALTPAHFLIGQPITTMPEVPTEHIKLALPERWRVVQNIYQNFWKRWHLEYLHSLQQRPKWQRVEPNLQPGDLVVVKESNMPPAKWLLGRVIEAHPDRDNLTRVVTIRTAHGTFKRPSIKLCKLPVNSY